MAVDARKHTTLLPGEKPTRQAIAAGIFSPNDVIPVANKTEQKQVATAVAAAGVNLAVVPIVTARADARGLHRIEYSYDGNVFLPVSGDLTFDSVATANAWASANVSLLALGDTARIGSVEYSWSGTAWVPWSSGWEAITGGALSSESGALGTSGADHTWRYVDGMVVDAVRIAIGAVGTGAGALFITLPVPVVGLWSGAGRSGVDGAMLAVTASGTRATVFRYNNTSAIGVGTSDFTIMYRPA